MAHIMAWHCHVSFLWHQEGWQCWVTRWLQTRSTGDRGGEGEAVAGLAEAKEQGQLPTDVAASHWCLLVSNLILWLSMG